MRNFCVPDSEGHPLKMRIHLRLQLGDLAVHFGQGRFVALGKLLHPTGQGLADAIHLTVNGGGNCGKPFVINDQRFDLLFTQ